MSGSELLRRAADALESGELKWGQGGGSGFKPPAEDCFCAATSLFNCWEFENYRRTSGAMNDAITRLATQVGEPGEREVHGVWGVVYRWNDAPGRTLAEVVAAMRSAAA